MSPGAAQSTVTRAAVLSPDVVEAVTAKRAPATATPLSQLTQPPPGCQAVHVAAAGEWLRLIANNAGATIDAVAYTNGIPPDGFLQPFPGG
ncbi:MAG: hypothetical protein IT318_12285 [Anaerolineales bacterium]|nr:hypothetical protein [Anaerolineales bacterium]